MPTRLLMLDWRNRVGHTAVTAGRHAFATQHELHLRQNICVLYCCIMYTPILAPDPASSTCWDPICLH